MAAVDETPRDTASDRVPVREPRRVRVPGAADLEGDVYLPQLAERHEPPERSDERLRDDKPPHW